MESLTLDKKVGSSASDGRDPMEWVKIKLEEWANSSDSDDSVIQVINEEDRDRFRKGYHFRDELKVEEDSVTKEIPETIDLVRENEVEAASSKNNGDNAQPVKNDARGEVPANEYQDSLSTATEAEKTDTVVELEETFSTNCWITVGSAEIKLGKESSLKDHQDRSHLPIVEEPLANNLFNGTDTVKDEPGEELPTNSSLCVEQIETNKLSAMDCIDSTCALNISERNGTSNGESPDLALQSSIEKEAVEDPDTQDPEESVGKLQIESPTADTLVISRAKSRQVKFSRRKTQRRKTNIMEAGQDTSSKLEKKLEEGPEIQIPSKNAECVKGTPDPPYCQKSQKCRRKPQKYTDCKKSIAQHSKPRKPASVHSDKKAWTCKVCEKCLTSRPRLAKHEKLHIGKRCYQCTECKKSFRWKSVLRRHHKIHTGEKPFECPECRKQFRDSSVLKGHRRTHTGERPYQCTECEKRFALSSDLTNHLRTHTGEKPYICTECEKSFTRSSDLLRHHKIHTGEKPYTCRVCSKAFNQAANLRQHLRFHTGDRPFQCPECERSFTQKADLAIHQKIHIEKPYKCPECEKRFSSSSVLLQHGREHTGQKPYQCDICDKQFLTLSRLKLHQKIHTGERAHLCTQCKKCFLHRSHLLRHLRIHSGEKPFECTECRKTFSQSSHLVKHQRLHAGDILNQCKECGKIFRSSSGLRRHQRVHTGEKPYECTECNKQFTQAAHLKRHKSCHEKKVTLVEGDSIVGNIHERVGSTLTSDLPRLPEQWAAPCPLLPSPCPSKHTSQQAPSCPSSLHTEIATCALAPTIDSIIT